jgi:hypothetical protein
MFVPACEGRPSKRRSWLICSLLAGHLPNSCSGVAAGLAAILAGAGLDNAKVKLLDQITALVVVATLGLQKPEPSIPNVYLVPVFLVDAKSKQKVTQKDKHPYDIHRW